MKLWVGITDKGWFDYLAPRSPDEVNFWQPSGNVQFRALSPGEPFLFKLHSPDDYIVGGGFFVRFSALPASLAWDAFGTKNGVADYADLLSRIRKYREKGQTVVREPDPVIGCNVLTDPFFFSRRDRIPVPAGWAPNIVRGKTFDTAVSDGAELWQSVQLRLKAATEKRYAEVEDLAGRYGPGYLTRARLGQGAFRVLVTDAYHRRCAITGERTLPVLEAAHIKPFSASGPHIVQNGILLRSDLHKLFDVGYLTITPELRVEVSRRIREEYENGHEYYAHHGRPLAIAPDGPTEKPAKAFLEWHNQNVFVP